MNGGREDDPTLAIQAHDSLGGPVDPELIAAARRNWKRVLLYAERQGHDRSVAAGVLERTVQALSSLAQRHPNSKNRIKNLDSYVFVVVVRRLNKLTARRPSIEYVGSLDDLNALQGARDLSWVSRLENEIALKELLEYMNKKTKVLFSLRQMGYKWKQIARRLGTSANNLESQFSQGMARTRKRMLAQTGGNSTQGSKRSE